MVDKISKQLPWPYSGTCVILMLLRNTPYFHYIQHLRKFRDEKLKPSKLGRIVVGIYYKLSPKLMFLVKTKSLRIISLGILLITLSFLKYFFHRLTVARE